MAASVAPGALATWIWTATKSQIDEESAAAYAKLLNDAGYDGVGSLSDAAGDFDAKIGEHIECVNHRQVLKSAVDSLSWLPEFLDKLLAQVDYLGAGGLSMAQLGAQALRSGRVRGERADESELRSLCDRVMARQSSENGGDSSQTLSRCELLQAFGQFTAETGDSAREVLEELLLGSTLKVYFGFGSNMSMEGLCSKGMHPISQRRAILKDYRLSFSLAPIYSKLNPAFANIVPSSGDEVHGVAIVLDDADLAKMDRLEGGYERHPIQLQAYEADGGEDFMGVAYFFSEEISLRAEGAMRAIIMFEERPPSRRYLNMLLQGATSMQLDPKYIEFLNNFKVTPLPDVSKYFTADLRAQIEKRTYTLEDVEASTAEGAEGPALTCLKGVVAEVYHPFYIRLLAGRDATMFQCLRVRVIESLDEMGDDHKEWVNACLAELCAWTVEAPQLVKVTGITSAYSTFDW